MKRRIKVRDFGYGNDIEFCATLVGKTIERFTLDGESVGVLFTDGTWIFGEADIDSIDDSAHLDFDAGATPFEQHDLGIITDEEFEASKAEKAQAIRANKLNQFERLKAELGL